MPSEKNHRELIDLSRLNERNSLEELVESSESTRKNDERHRILDEHRLADEEVTEVDKCIDVRIRALLERQLDVASDRSASTDLRTLVPCLHDPGTCAGDDRESRFREEPRDFLRSLVLRIFRRCARRPEYRDALLDGRQGIEAFDELTGDPHYTPRISPREIHSRRWLLKELFILRHRRHVGANRVVNAHRRARLARGALARRRGAPGRPMTRFGALPHPGAGVLFRRCTRRDISSLSGRCAWLPGRSRCFRPDLLRRHGGNCFLFRHMAANNARKRVTLAS